MTDNALVGYFSETEVGSKSRSPVNRSMDGLDTTDLTTFYDSTPVDSGSGETDVIYRLEPDDFPAGSDLIGYTFCDNAVYDQQYVNFKPNEAVWAPPLSRDWPRNHASPWPGPISVPRQRRPHHLVHDHAIEYEQTYIWVTYGDYLLPFTATSIRRQSRTENEIQRGEGVDIRLVTVALNQPLWKGLEPAHRRQRHWSLVAEGGPSIQKRGRQNFVSTAKSTLALVRTTSVSSLSPT